MLEDLHNVWKSYMLRGRVHHVIKFDQLTDNSKYGIGLILRRDLYRRQVVKIGTCVPAYTCSDAHMHMQGIRVCHGQFFILLTWPTHSEFKAPTVSTQMRHFNDFSHSFIRMSLSPNSPCALAFKHGALEWDKLATITHHTTSEKAVFLIEKMCVIFGFFTAIQIGMF